jgi:hypothetical protein
VIEHSIDNGLVIGGVTASVGVGANDFILMKVDTVGVAQWTRTYGAASNEEAYGMVEHSIDNGFVLVGTSQSFGTGGDDILCVKTSSVGVEQWTKVRVQPCLCLFVLCHMMYVCGVE